MLTAFFRKIIQDREGDLRSCLAAYFGFAVKYAKGISVESVSAVFAKGVLVRGSKMRFLIRKGEVVEKIFFVLLAFGGLAY